ncbi:MAG: futalosine hydrolase, partial [Nitrospiraceae bacterium]
FPVRLFINIGIGGAYAGAGLDIGDVALASSELYGDEGVSARGGIKGLKEIGIPLLQRGRKRYFNEFPISLPKGPLVCGQRDRPFSVKPGRFVTVSAVSGTPERAAELETRFHALCENMEGAAVAQVCALYRVRLHEVRGISNIAGIRDKRKWNVDRAVQNCQRTVLELIAPS